MGSQPAKAYTQRDREFATYLGRERVQRTLQLAADLQADVEAVQRQVKQFCKACHYFPTIAGQAFTNRDCGCCGETQTYPNTATDVLCQPCAVKEKACRHCGGDMD